MTLFESRSRPSLTSVANRGPRNVGYLLKDSYNRRQLWTHSSKRLIAGLVTHFWAPAAAYPSSLAIQGRVLSPHNFIPVAICSYLICTFTFPYSVEALAVVVAHLFGEGRGVPAVEVLVVPGKAVDQEVRLARLVHCSLQGV